MPERQKSADQSSERGRRAQQPEHAAQPERHPLLTLQQTVGNGAVQRLVSSLPARPGVIQRVLSPSTTLMGYGTHARLHAGWMNLFGRMQTLQGQTGDAMARTMAMVGDIGRVLNFVAVAQSEPAPPPAGEVGGTLSGVAAAGGSIPGGQTTLD